MDWISRPKRNLYPSLTYKSLPSNAITLPTQVKGEELPENLHDDRIFHNP